MDEQKIKDWLKEFHHSRQWLAQQLTVAPKTVNNWLGSDRAIPAKAINIIERLMEADRLRSNSAKSITHTMTLEFSSEDFDQIEEAARRNQKKNRTWATDALREMASRDTQEIVEQIHHLKAAESPQSYNHSPNGAVGKSG